MKDIAKAVGILVAMIAIPTVLLAAALYLFLWVWNQFPSDNRPTSWPDAVLWTIVLVALTLWFSRDGSRRRGR